MGGGFRMGRFTALVVCGVADAEELSQERVPAPGKHAVCERLHVEVFSVCNGQEKRPKCAYFFCFLRVFLLAWYGGACEGTVPCADGSVKAVYACDNCEVLKYSPKIDALCRATPNTVCFVPSSEQRSSGCLSCASQGCSFATHKRRKTFGTHLMLLARTIV